MQFTHETLGELTYDENNASWEGEISMKKFERFRWGSGLMHHRPTVVFMNYPDLTPPTMEACHLISTVIKKQEEIIEKIADGLWEDFHGRIEGAYNWWSGDLTSVNEIAGDDPPIHNREDIYKGMSFQGIHYTQDDPYLMLAFDAWFEEEHGMGFLWDGDNIIGIGDSECEPFES